MLTKLSQLSNIPIINLNTGNTIETVNDFILDVNKEKLQAFLVEEDLYLPFECIKNLGRDFISVNTDNKEELFKKLEMSLTPPVFLPKDLIGLPVITEQGKMIGIINDIILDLFSGRIQSYELSDGLFKDLLKGREKISLRQVESYGEDLLIIKESSVF